MTHRTDSLDVPLEDFEQMLTRCAAMIRARYATMYEADAHPGVSEHEVHAWFDEPLPENPMDTGRLLDEVADKVYAHPTMNLGTKMFAYVMSGGTQVSVAADLLASAIDQNPAKWHLGPAMTEIERRVIAWTGTFIGLDAHNAGAIVSGGSAANLTGLTIARNRFAARHDARRKGLTGLPPLVTYGSDQTHASVAKSLELLGLGSDNFREIPAGPDGTLAADALRAAIAIDRAAGREPFCVVANAGSVNTGAIDPIAELAAVAHEGGLWLHVDGAYGGLAASLPALRGHYRGLAEADSIALDYHKWLYQPFEVGCTLVRDWQMLRESFDRDAAYLDFGRGDERFDISRHHFALSRNAKAFKVWMSFKAYGAARLREMIAKDIACAEHLAALARDAADFELVSRGPLGIVCLRYLGKRSADAAAVDRINDRLIGALERDGRVFITGTRLAGRPVLRACIINHRMTSADIDYLVTTIRDVARSLSMPA